MQTNILQQTDSYKVTHFKQYPPGTETVYSYFESRGGAKFDTTVFFGLQYLIAEYLAGAVVTQEMIDRAADLYESHFGDVSLFNRAGWEHILNVHGGRLPLRIKAVPEGTPVPVGNVLMTVENTDPACWWLTNYVESLLTHVWYPSTVATLSWNVRKRITEYIVATGGDTAAVDFMLHDFGYRGATTNEAAAIGGAGHLINFMGTDTIPAMVLLAEFYDAHDVAFSVAATEHSVMTAEGTGNDIRVLDRLIKDYPSGILSVVSDSYDIYAFTDYVVSIKDQILARDGRFVLRPDSITDKHKTPEKLVIDLFERLWAGFGGSVQKGRNGRSNQDFRVLNDKVRILWGDGIDPDGINAILWNAEQAGIAAENFVFGMGGGLLQKVNRDTQRFAFKCSAQFRDGEWHDISKEPLDASKKSKAGRLALTDVDGGTLKTVKVEDDTQGYYDVLRVVFENGEPQNVMTFDEVRKNAGWIG